MVEAMKIFKSVKTVEDALDAAYGNRTFGEPYDSVLRKNFKPVEYLASQTGQADELTALCYGTMGSQVTFPLAYSKLKGKITPFRGTIGQQTSRYHAEGVEYHLYTVIAGIKKDLDRDDDVTPREYNLALLMGLLHDCAKEYNTLTSQRGELCFYGHEQLSSIFAAYIFAGLGIDRVEAAPYITAIWDHGEPQRTDFTTPEIRKKYADEKGEKTLWLLDLIRQNDIGIRTEEELRREENIKKFLEGRKIARYLSEITW